MFCCSYSSLSMIQGAKSSQREDGEEVLGKSMTSASSSMK